MDDFIAKYGIWLLVVFYVASFGFMLLNSGVFWDDWTIYSHSPDNIWEVSRQIGLWFNGALFSSIISMGNSIFIFRSITFVSYLLAALFLNAILSTIKQISPLARFFILVFFTLLPLNTARIAISVTQYAVGHCLFFLGFWLISKYATQNRLIYRLLALPVFFLSFSTNSLLVFYIVVLLYLFFYKDSSDPGFIFTPKIVAKKCIRYFDLVVLPIIHWIIKSVYFVPFGPYQGYNQFKIAETILSPIGAILIFLNSFIQSLNTSISLISATAIFWAIVLSLVVYKYNPEALEDEEHSQNRRFFFQGTILFFLGVFPYIAVGRVLEFNTSFNTRHQLLMPLGSALILYYGLRLFLTKIKLNMKIQILLFSVLIMLFINANFANCIAFQRDWFKQLALVENMKVNQVVRDHTTFLFEDNTTEWNVYKRNYAIYEYTGLMRYAFGDQKRFGTIYRKFTKIEDYQTIFNEWYNMRDYKPRAPEYKVLIKPGNYSLNKEENIFNLLWLEKSNPLKFREELKRVLELEVIQL